MMIPKNMGRDDLLKILDVIREGVESGDTLDARIEFVQSEQRGALHQFDVTAVFLTGQQSGDGSPEVVGEFDGGRL